MIKKANYGKVIYFVDIELKKTKLFEDNEITANSPDMFKPPCIIMEIKKAVIVEEYSEVFQTTMIKISAHKDDTNFKYCRAACLFETEKEIEKQINKKMSELRVLDIKNSKSSTVREYVMRDFKNFGEEIKQ